MKKYNIILAIMIIGLMLFYSTGLIIPDNPTNPSNLFMTNYPVIIGFIIYLVIIGIQKVITD